MIKKQTLIELAAAISWCGDAAERCGMLIAGHTILMSLCGRDFAWKYHETVTEIDNYIFKNNICLSEGELANLISRERFFDWMDTL